MSHKAAIYLEVARRAKQHSCNALATDYYEMYAKEKEENPGTRNFTLEEISIAVNSIRLAQLDGTTHKIQAIKRTREATNMGLKDAKELVESVMGESPNKGYKDPANPYNY